VLSPESWSVDLYPGVRGGPARRSNPKKVGTSQAGPGQRRLSRLRAIAGHGGTCATTDMSHGSADLPKIGEVLAQRLCLRGTIREMQLKAVGRLWYRDQVSDTRRSRNELHGPGLRTPLLVHRRVRGQDSSGMGGRNGIGRCGSLSTLTDLRTAWKPAASMV